MKDVIKADIKDINKFVADKREELRKFRFGIAGANTKNVKFARTTKKEIARAMTELSARRNKGKLQSKVK